MTVKVHGLRELEAKLLQLEKKMAKKVMNKALRAAAKPVVVAAKAAAPTEYGDMAASIKASTQLTSRQSRINRRMNKLNGTTAAQMFIGPSGPDGAPIGFLVEFGTAPHMTKGQFIGQHPGTTPQPFMRPAWSSTKDQVLNIIKEQLAAEIQKAIGKK